MPLYSYGCLSGLMIMKILEFEDYFNKDGICIIEWSELIEDRLPSERLDINFKIVDENTRVLLFVPHGEQYEELCNAVL